MQVEFALDETDLVALAKHHMQHSPALRRRYRALWIGASAGFGLLGALIYVLFALAAPALYLLAFGAFFLVFFPYYYRWLAGRTLRKIVRARQNPKMFAPRFVRATPDGLELVSAEAKTARDWSRITGIAVTPDHAFVAVDGQFAVVLPRRRLGDEPFQRLIETIRRSAKLTS